MSLISDISDLITAKYPDATFILSSEMKANLASYNLDEITTAKPLIVLNNELESEDEIQQNANILQSTRVEIWVLAKCKDGVYTSDNDMNTDLEVLQTIIQSIYGGLFRLGNVLLNAGEVSRFTRRPVFKVWNSVLNGWKGSARIKYNTTVNVCTS